MSGVAGADRVKSREDYQKFLASYKSIIAKFPGFVSIQPSGSYNSNLAKNDFGDIDLITHIKSSKNKKEVKQSLVQFFEKMPDTVITAFTSEKHAGRRSYNSGEIVTVRYHDHALGYSAQIDNIIALDHIEAGFKQEFLDMPAEKQGLVLGLVKIAAIETDPKVLFKKLSIHIPVNVQSNQEFEFNLSSSELQLRKVTYEPGTYTQTDREILWRSQKWSDLQALLYQYDLSSDFDTLLTQSKQTIKNPRSNNRMQGVFSSMISVKSGEVGTAKGAGKEAALGRVKQTFGEGRSRLLNELVKPKQTKVVFAFVRFQPPTAGHELLIKTVKNTAKAQQCSYIIYVSKTQDHKKNPLSIEQKMMYLNKFFPDTNFVAAGPTTRTPIEVAKELNQKYSDLIVVAGSDRIPNFTKLLNDYNHKEYEYNTINFVSAGNRDPDADDVTGVSGTDVRQAALDNNFEAFKQNLPSTADDITAQSLMQDVQAGLTPVKKIKKAAPAEDASGVIATKAQANDPRYSMSLTKDVRPGQVEKNLKAFSLEAMLPKSAFAGTKKNKINGKGMKQGSDPTPVKAGDLVGEEWSAKYKSSINCSNPKGFSQKAHCAGKKKNEDQRLDPKCWKGYRKSGTKMKGGTRVNNCVKIGEAWEQEMSNAVNKLLENFADGKNPGRKGLAKRSGVDTKASVSDLRKTAKNSTGEKQRMAHWLANMKAGRAKKK
jgi:nicotinic acid mononucleotide adenylyltransferase